MALELLAATAGRKGCCVYGSVQVYFQKKQDSAYEGGIFTKAVIVFPYWLVFKAITKELKLLRQIPIGENAFMRPTTTGSYDPLNFIK